MKHTINTIKNNIKFNTIVDSFDYFILTIVIFCLLGDIISLLSSLINIIFEYSNLSVSNLISCIVDNSTSTTVTTPTVTTPTHTVTVPSTSSNPNAVTITNIIHEDGSWSNTVKSIFIYGSGAFRLHLTRNGGTPATRAFVIASTLAADALSRVVNNTINDPSYIKSHVINWKFVWQSKTEGAMSIEVDSDTAQKLAKASSNKFLGDDINLNDLIQEYMSGVFNSLKFVLEPIQVNYSNEVLANQIYDLSILLFILSILITGLILVLLLNVLIYMNMDRIIKYFKNKYIRWYLFFNKKFLGIEIFMLGTSILYFMYNLSIGIRFIATHPIILN